MKIYLVEGVRSPFGALNGGLSGLSAPQLAAPLMAKLLQRLGLQAIEVDEVILGQVIQAAVGQAPARQAMLKAGLAESTPAMTINKVCGSGLKAIMLAADAIQLSHAKIVLAGGMESMSQAPHALHLRQGQAMGDASIKDLLFLDALTDPYSGQPMGVLTEARILEKKVSRQAQDQYATMSYERAQSAQAAGLFDEEILPITLQGKQSGTVITQDEEPTKVNFEKISSLRPVFSSSGSITAANASSIDDGAAVVLVASDEMVKAKKLKPLAEIKAYCQHSQAPDHFSLAPVGAMQKLLKMSGLTVKDIDLWEVNEAFAAVPLMAALEMDIPLDKMNILGGAVSLGHPVGASGARLALTLAKQLQRNDQRYGVATLCIGGGEAVAMLLEKVAF